MQYRLNILVACEESQALTVRLRELGHEAYSCDILPCSGGHPEWHLQQDVTGLLNHRWDMIIGFPPCTYLTVTGNRWFDISRYGELAKQRHKEREKAINFFLTIANAESDYIAIENPVGVMSSVWRKPDQIIQPYQFGDAYEKRTCLWLKGLPKLKPTNIVAPPTRRILPSGKTMPVWYADAWNLPKKERAKMRSRTFPGVAHAMATQWTTFIIDQLRKNDR